MIPEPMSSRLDRKHRAGLIIGVAVMVLLLIMGPVFNTLQLSELHQLGNQNHALNVSDHRVLTSEVGALQQQIASQKQTIASQNDVIQQAVSAIETLAKKCEAAPPCTPGNIELKAPPGATVP